MRFSVGGIYSPLEKTCLEPDSCSVSPVSPPRAFHLRPCSPHLLFIQATLGLSLTRALRGMNRIAFCLPVPKSRHTIAKLNSIRSDELLEGPDPLIGQKSSGSVDPVTRCLSMMRCTSCPAADLMSDGPLIQ